MTPCPQPVTERQLRVLAAVHRLTAENGYPPTLRELGDELGISSTNGVNDHLKALEKKRCLTRGEMKTRSLVLTPSGLDLVEQHLRETATVEVGRGE